MKNNLFSLKPFFWELVLFSLTLGLGIFSAQRINKILKIEQITLQEISILEFLGWFFILTLIFIAFIYYKKRKKGKNLIYNVFFIFSLFVGGQICLSALLNHNFIALLIIVSLIYLWRKKPLIYIHNLLLAFSLAGIGAFLGLSLKPEIVVLLLAIFSIYDVIAVYWTKHMVKMAEEMLLHKIIIGFILPVHFSGFKENIGEIGPSKGNFMILGGGDVAFPLMLSASLVPLGIEKAVIVAAFASMGLLLSFLIFVKQKRKPIPALPPIALFSIIGYFIIRLI